MYQICKTEFLSCSHMHKKGSFRSLSEHIAYKNAERAEEPSRRDKRGEEQSREDKRGAERSREDKSR